MELDVAIAFVRDHQAAVLATVKADGRPQLSNINYGVDADGVILISVTDGRAKTANVRRDPRVSLHVTSEAFWPYVVVEATAELSAVAAEPDDAVVEALVAQYRMIVGEHDDWDDFRRAMVADRRLLMRLRATHAYGTI